jgi:8-oxo-dGTP pyrophosphatase MutT (NUDIX family)
MGMNEDTPFRTRGPAVDPADRPTKSRRAVRVLLRAPSAVLLFHDTDPGLPGAQWWTTPGGGIDGDESDLAAAVREIAEETGLDVEASRFSRPLARRVVRHGYSDQVTVQTETFFELSVPEPFAISTAGHTPGEQESLVGHRWWPIGEIATTSEIIWPANLPFLLTLPDVPPASPDPIELPTVEESTVPISPEGPTKRG